MEAMASGLALTLDLVGLTTNLKVVTSLLRNPGYKVGFLFLFA
mgnify:FL=1